MKFNERLVYDVGMHNGDDTAYYLHCGFDVVAIEADPTLVAHGRERFAAEIAAGRLTLLPVGIAPQAGTATFWLSEGQSEWNSFNRSNATRRGRTCRPIEVRCRPFHEILAEYGVPQYLKIDIETFDRHCLEALDPRNLPPYTSIEINEFEELLILQRLGYDSFKLVLQGHHAPLHDETRSLKAWFLRLIEPIPALVRLTTKLASLTGKLRRLGRRLARRNGEDWKFPFGSSGPIGEEAAGEWLDFEEAAYRFLALARMQPGRIWCDVHATRRAPQAGANDSAHQREAA